VPIPDNALPPVGKAMPLLEVEADALEADLLVRMGANEEAEKKLHPLFARAPTLPVVRTTLARLRLDAGQPEEAATLLSDVVRDQPDDLGAMLLLSAAHLESGALPDAVIAAERATALNTEAPGAWAALSLAAAVAGQAEQAESALAHLLKLNPEPRHIAQRAHDAFRLGCPTVAARDTALFLQRAGITHEMAPYLAFVGALSHRRLGQSDEANRLLERLGPVVEAGAWTEKVLRYLQGWLGADDFLQHAKDNGQKTEAHFYVGYQDLLGGRSSSALTHFRWIKERGAKNYTEYRNALAELARLEKAGAGSSK
jgi:lipoprotein NlpI